MWQLAQRYKMKRVRTLDTEMSAIALFVVEQHLGEVGTRCGSHEADIQAAICDTRKHTANEKKR
jgi:hypothetical protein